jgi:hypothetical protein
VNRDEREKRAFDAADAKPGWRVVAHFDRDDEDKKTYDVHSPSGTKFKVRRDGRDFNSLTRQTPGNPLQETKGLTIEEVEEILRDR